MLFTETYETALAAPTARKGKGWKYAEGASMQAAYAMALGTTHCMNAQAIYDWANRHDVSLRDQRKRLQPFNDVLLVAVLNDLPLDQTEKELQQAQRSQQ
jgi:hypothetical protein